MMFGIGVLLFIINAVSCGLQEMHLTHLNAFVAGMLIVALFEEAAK